MPETRTLTVTLPAEEVARIEECVAVGDAESADAYVAQAIADYDPTLRRDLATAAAQLDTGESVDAFEFLEGMRRRALARIAAEPET